MTTKEEQLNQLISQRDVLASQLSDLNNKIFDFAQEMIPDYAKYQVGQDINDQRGNYKITKVIASVGKSFSNNKFYLSFKYYGNKILKSGKLHKNQTNLYWLQW